MFKSFSQGKTSKREADYKFVDKYLLNTNEFVFEAYGRKFQIYLKKNFNILADDVNIEITYANNTSNYLKDVYTTNFYTGFVDDDKNSFVILFYDHNQILKNKTIIYGKIELGSETFYIEVSKLLTVTVF